MNRSRAVALPTTTTLPAPGRLVHSCECVMRAHDAPAGRDSEDSSRCLRNPNQTNKAMQSDTARGASDLAATSQSASLTMRALVLEMELHAASQNGLAAIFACILALQAHGTMIRCITDKDRNHITDTTPARHQLVAQDRHSMLGTRSVSDLFSSLHPFGQRRMFLHLAPPFSSAIPSASVAQCAAS